MEVIFSDIPLKTELIEEMLGSLFSELVVFKYEIDHPMPVWFDLNNPRHILYSLETESEKIEFGYCLTIARTPEIDSQERTTHMIQWLVKKLNMRFLMTYSNPDNPSYPYYCLIFENSKVYLADDSNTNFADGETGFVREIKPINVPEIKFTKMGDRID